jgi:hypothetical protein
VGRQSLKRLLLCGMLLAVSVAAPALADTSFTDFGDPCAILKDNTGTFIEIADVGTVPDSSPSLPVQTSGTRHTAPTPGEHG